MNITRYTSEHQNEWDDFVRQSKNGTFILQRSYMDYHSDRFTDHSLMFRNDKGHLVALLPANINGNTLYSHQGLTYGGLVMSIQIQAEQVITLFQLLMSYLRENNITRLIYKPIPHIYHRYPAEEDLYALFMVCQAQLSGRNISCIVNREASLPWSENRRRNQRKATASGITVSQSDDFPSFWHLLEENLMETYGAKPVHSLPEIQRLHALFPDNIRLYMAYSVDGRPLAGTVLYLDNGIAHTQYISASAEGKSQHALDALFHQLLTADMLSVSEYPVFDFGTSNEDGGKVLNESLIHQKQGFGGRAVCYDTYTINL